MIASLCAMKGHPNTLTLIKQKVSFIRKTNTLATFYVENEILASVARVISSDMPYRL